MYPTKPLKVPPCLKCRPEWAPSAGFIQIAALLPATSSLAPGDVVPIPTYRFVPSILKATPAEVLNDKSYALLPPSPDFSSKWYWEATLASPDPAPLLKNNFWSVLDVLDITNTPSVSSPCTCNKWEGFDKPIPTWPAEIWLSVPSV